MSVKCDDYDDDRGEACEVEEIDLTSHDHDIVLHLFFLSKGTRDEMISQAFFFGEQQNIKWQQKYSRKNIPLFPYALL